MTEAQHCRVCGDIRNPAQASAMAWARERDPGGRLRWLCAGCARNNLRAIEAKLPEEYW
jgi:hypothetical protein